MSIAITPSAYDFTPLHQRMHEYVDAKTIPFFASAVLKGNDVVDVHYYGNIDMEGGPALDASSIFRMASSTKMACSVAAMMLVEANRIALDDPLSDYIPAFKDMQVLQPDATALDQTSPAQQPILIRHILSHTAGLSYGFVDPESVLDQAYNASALNPLAAGSQMTLATLCDGLGELPLAFEPGSFWRYSFATDVVARLIEVVSRTRFDDFLKTHLFNPLGMHDTDFFVPADKLARLTTLYLPSDVTDQTTPCVMPMDTRHASAAAVLPSFLSGGGGLVSTLTDYLAFARMIINQGEYNGHRLLKPETLALMRTDQCPAGVSVNFPVWDMPNTGFGLGFALKHQPAQGEPNSAIGEYHWGGLTGNHFWWSPKANLTGICMTQRMPSFWSPHSHEFKRLVHRIAAA